MIERAEVIVIGSGGLGAARGDEIRSGALVGGRAAAASPMAVSAFLRVGLTPDSPPPSDYPVLRAM